MKTDRITKMYDHLTNKERAMLAFRYMTEMNEVELDRIEATVPRHTYQCLDLDYQSWLGLLFHFASAWAIDYWQTYVKKVAATAVALDLSRRGGELEQVEASFEKLGEWEAQLVALDRALEAVCAEHGFDADSVRRWAGVGTFAPPHGNTEPDARLQAEMNEILSTFFRGRE